MCLFLVFGLCLIVDASLCSSFFVFCTYVCAFNACLYVCACCCTIMMMMRMRCRIGFLLGFV